MLHMSLIDDDVTQVYYAHLSEVYCYLMENSMEKTPNENFDVTANRSDVYARPCGVSKRRYDDLYEIIRISVFP